MMIRSNKIRAILMALIVIILIYMFNLNEKPVVRSYHVKTEKVDSGIRIAFLADLHDTSYGENQSILLDMINRQNPDIIMFGGDMIDKRTSVEAVTGFILSLAKEYPCYYVSGNNEVSSGKYKILKNNCIDSDMFFLEGGCHALNINGQSINICGVEDPLAGKEAFNEQLGKTIENRESNLYTILLAHRPEHIEKYSIYDYDLVLSAHTHGGVWRIPYIMNGLYAHNQGLFPKYAGGIYKIDDTIMIVSRGLAKYTKNIPRIFNPPELVIVDILHGQTSYDINENIS